jgi:hypothetical protein
MFAKRTDGELAVIAVTIDGAQARVADVYRTVKRHDVQGPRAGVRQRTHGVVAVVAAMTAWN